MKTRKTLMIVFLICLLSFNTALPVLAEHEQDEVPVSWEQIDPNWDGELLADEEQEAAPEQALAEEQVDNDIAEPEQAEEMLPEEPIFVEEEPLFETVLPKSEYIVSFREPTDISAFFSEHNELTTLHSRQADSFNILNENDVKKIAKLSLNATEKSALVNDPHIRFIEPNSPVRILNYGVPTKDGDSYVFRNSDGDTINWGLHSVGGDIAHQANRWGSGVKIAVLDTGISHHPDLQIAGGVSFVEGVSSYADDNGHGTHVAGIIGAQLNGVGVAGVAPHAELYAVKVLDAMGNGTYGDVIAGIQWAIDNQMDIISISFGGTEHSEILHEAVMLAEQAGVLIVAAAGNAGAGDNTLQYPAVFQEVVAVGAVKKNFERAIFSSTGSTLDIVAPGTDVLSTTYDGDYGVSSGTSAAVPFVAGAAALFWAENSTLVSSDVKNALIQHATPLGSQHEYGHGLINAARSIGLIQQPIPPVFLGVDDSEPEWIPPVFDQDGDVHISAYGHTGVNQTIQPGQSATVSLMLSEPKAMVYIGVFNPAGDKIAGTEISNAPMDTPISYTWYSSPTQALGVYMIKYAYSGTPLTDWFTVEVASPGIPAIPNNVSYQATNSSLLVYWDAVPTATSYIVKLDGVSYTTTDTNRFFNGLVQGRAYRVEVAAVNAWGTSSFARILPDPRVVASPPTPTGLTITNVSHDSMRLNWTNMGAGLQYVVRVNNTVVGSTSNNYYIFTGLQPNTAYTLEVASQNGDQQRSAYTSANKVTLFPVPSGLHATDITNNSVTLRWNVINGAQFSIKKDGQYVTTVSTNSYTFNSLEANATYSFSVASKNSNGALSLENSISQKTSANSIIYVPGFLGTDIYLRNELKRLWPVNRVLTPNLLQLNEEGTSNLTYHGAPTLYFDPILGDRVDSGERFIEFFLKTRHNIDVSEVGYDWRKDLRLASENVRQAVDQAYSENMGQKVTLVTHSTGGIVAKYYLITDPTAKDKVSNFINIVSPNLGTPYSIKGLTVGDDLGVIEGRIFPFTIQEAKDMVQNFPSIYQLMPGKKYVDAYNDFYYQHFPSFYTYHFDDGINPVEPIVRTYSDTVDYIKTHHNTNLYEVPEDANSFRYAIENNSIHPDIKEYRIIGYGYNNIIQLNNIQRFRYSSPSKYKAIWGEGDGLIPLLSAEFDQHDSAVKYYVNNSHMNVLTRYFPENNYVSPMYDIVKRIVVDKSPPSASLYPRPSMSRMLGHSVDINCPVVVEVVDQYGNRAYVNEDGFVINDIPDLSFEMVGESKLLFIPAGLTVTLNIQGTDEGIMDVGFTKYEEAQPTQTNIVDTLLIQDTTEASFTFTGGSDASQTAIFYDYDGDGQGTTVYPTRELTPSEYYDNTYLDNELPTAPLHVEASNIMETEVTLSWQPSQDNLGVTGYSIYSGETLHGTTSDTSYTVTGLQPRTAYTFHVVARDSSANFSAPSAAVAVTTDYIDVTPPSVPNHVQVLSRTETNIVVSWDASTDDVAVKEYQVFQDGQLAGTVEAPLFEANNLLPDTTYVFTIKAIDDTGNLSAASVALSARTPVTIVPPTVTGNGGEWTSGDVTILVAADEYTGTATRATQYKVGALGEWINYENPIAISAEGETTVYARTIDNYDNVSMESSTSVRIDKTAPSAPTVVSSHPNWTSSDVTLTITSGTDVWSGVDKSQYKVGEEGQWTEYSVPVMLTQEGVATVFARTLDQVGNIGEVTETVVRIDKTAPGEPSVSLSNTDWSTSPVQVDITAGTDELSGTASVQFRLNDSANWAEYVEPFVIEHQGETSIYARTADLAGNYSEALMATAKYDTAPPVTAHTLSGQSSNGWYRTNVGIDLQASDEAGSGVEQTYYRINNGSYVTYTSPIVIEREGSYTITYYSTDMVGNTEEERTVQFEVDFSAPAAPLITQQRHMFPWTKADVRHWVNDRATIVLTDASDGDSNIERMQYRIGESGDWVVYLQPFTIQVPIEGLYIYARSVDHAGNISSTRNLFLAEYVISASANSPFIAIQQGSGNKVYANTLNLVSVHVQEITSVHAAEGGILNINYRYINTANSQVFSTLASFPLNYESDIQYFTDWEAPSRPIDLRVASKDESSVVIEWEESTDNVGVVAYDIYSGSELIASTASTSYYVGNLIFNTVYHFRVIARDAEGNASVPSNTLSVLTSIDVEPPTVPEGLTAYARSDSSISLSWLESSDDVAVRVYRVYRDGELAEITSELYAVVNSLFPNTEYVFTVEAEDGTGNRSAQSVPLTAATSRDQQPPAAPEGLTVTEVGHTSVRLSWQPSEDNVGVTGYRIYMEETFIEATEIEMYTMEDLLPNQLYTFAVTAVDAEGNESNPSVSVQKMLVQPNPPGKLAAYEHAAYLKSDGTVWTWGSNGSGQLGDQSLYNRTTMAQVPGIGNVVSVGTGEGFTLALKEDGTVWGWGNNSNYQLGSFSPKTQVVPQRVGESLEGVVKLAVGHSFAVALKEDGTVWVWGQSVYSSGGVVQVTELSSVVDIAAGKNFALVLKADGTVWGWGISAWGQLGEGNTIPRNKPVQTIIDGVAAIFAGASSEHAYALRSDGTLWGWGKNDFGQLGIGTTSNQLVPVRIVGMEQIRSVATSGSHTLALKADGTVWTWGRNDSGQLGDGTATNRAVPQQVSGLSNAVDIASGIGYSIVGEINGRIWSWGVNNSGQLGNGTTAQQRNPAQAKENTSPLVQVEMPDGSMETPAIVSTSTPVIGWRQFDDELTRFSKFQVHIRNASNSVIVNSGELTGDGISSWKVTSPLPLSTMLQVSVRVYDGILWSDWAEPRWMRIETATSGVKIAAAGNFTLVLRPDGRVWGTGSNVYGQLGLGNTVSRSKLERIQVLSNVREIAAGHNHGLALLQNGTVWSWGDNFSGQLGDGTNTMRLQPVQVSGLTSVVAIAAGNNTSYALKQDGTVWSWGSNFSGVLGNGSTVASSKVPVKVSNLSSITAISTSGGHTLAIDSQGTVRAWGSNNRGQLRMPQSVPSSSIPVQIFNPAEQIERIFAGAGVSYAIDKKGDVLALGSLGSAFQYTVTKLTEYPYIKALGAHSHVVAVLQDGAVRTWGVQNHDKLGNAVAINALRNVEHTAAGASHSVLVKRDGTIWTFGDNSYGQLGNGTLTGSSLPVQAEFAQ